MSAAKIGQSCAICHKPLRLRREARYNESGLVCTECYEMMKMRTKSRGSSSPSASAIRRNITADHESMKKKQFMDWLEKRPGKDSHGFTLVELLVTMSIIAILAGMLLGALRAAQDAAQVTYCSNNLRQMGQSIVMYEDAFRSMPLGDLPVSLKPYDGNRKLYVCPVDPDQQSDSYTPFYVCRSEQDTRKFVAGCWRHNDNTRGPVLYGIGAVKQCTMQPVYRKGNGNLVPFGVDQSNLTMRFADGSTAKLTGGGSMSVLMSYQESGGRYYHMVKVKSGNHCTVISTVTKGSAFEVITPAAIAEAWGTKYDTTTDSDDDDYISTLSVDEGIVGFSARAPGGKSRPYKAGQGKKIGLKKNRAPKD